MIDWLTYRLKERNETRKKWHGAAISLGLFSPVEVYIIIILSLSLFLFPLPTSLIAECSMDRNGIDYRGILNVTSTGSRCLPWHHFHSHQLLVDAMLNKNLESNFCRNPNNETSPWCFVGSIQRPRFISLSIFFFFLFRCVLAFLWEGVSIRRSVRQSVRPSVAHELDFPDFRAKCEQISTRNTIQFKRQFRDKYVGSLPEQIWYLTSVRLLLDVLFSTNCVFFLFCFAGGNTVKSLLAITLVSGPRMYRQNREFLRLVEWCFHFQ